MLYTLLALLIALIHIYIMVLEMVFWDKPRGQRVFRTTQEFATASKVMAFNQGLYNGFLAAGILIGLAMGSVTLTVFSLACVLVAGGVGFATGVKSAFYFQAIPAALALLAFWVGL